MIGTLLAGALLMGPDAGAVTIRQVAPPVATQSNEQDAPIPLEGVTVTGRPLTQLIQQFVNEVAAPNRGRGLARWDTRICVGVANLQVETAQYLADRISTVAGDLGVETGAPGCSPNLMIVATADGDALAREMVDEHERAMRMGGAGMDQGRTALAAFQASDQPVRWWQVSMPTDTDSGQQAVRLPGDCIGSCYGGGSAANFAPNISVFAASRLNTQIVDNLFRTIVIVDVDDVADVSIQQLADYIAMVSLAQIDPDADTTAYATILNVFNDPGTATQLTDWDLAYLRGLYGAVRGDSNLRAGRTEIRDSIRREHEALREDAVD